MSGHIIGLREPHFAVLTSDSSVGAVYEVPTKLAAAISATITPNINSSTLFADDVAVATSSALGAIEVELEVDQIAPAVLEELLGITRNEEGVLVYDGDLKAPYVALGFKAPLSSGANHFRYVWLTKGQFTIPTDSYQTQSDSGVEFQSKTISATFITREADRVWKFEVDSNELTVGKEAVATNWFKKVYEVGAIMP